MQKDLPKDAFVQYSVDSVDHNTNTKDITLIRDRAIKRLKSQKE